MSGPDDRDERQDSSQAGMPPASERRPTGSESSPNPRGELGAAPNRSPAQSKTTGAATKKRQYLEKARAESARVCQERIAAGKSANPDPIEKALANPQSRQLAIESKCYECGGRNADPGWRWEIGNCLVDCALLPFRPYQHLEGKPMPKARQCWGLLEPGEEGDPGDDET